MDLKNTGKHVGDIPVKINYRIIELFSAGLYSSPNKAFEELVSNSYDANATKVSVYIPTDRSLDDSTLWVCDNGDSMDKEGLKDLWKIGESNKLVGERINGKRLQIGKFGIGKLATYILTYKLTYICKTKEGYFAVMMDYGDINNETEKLSLDEIELTEDEAKKLINPYIIRGDKSLVSFELWGNKAEMTWTFTIMSKLKPKVNEIQDGRLKWILSTALPLNPDFKLTYNGVNLTSSKEAIEPIKSWVFGENDSVVEKHLKDGYSAGFENGKYFVNLPNLEKVHGRIDLYRESLVKGKSENWGRSHGIFLMVRERLINLDDPLLGMPAMTHGVFNRVRIIVNANELDNYITSTRENIKDSYPYENLKKYIQQKFTEVREYYFNLVQEEERKNLATYKIAHASASLSRRPLLIAARKFFAKEISSLILTKIPDNLTIDEQNAFIERLENGLTSDEGIIKDVRWIALSPEEPMAKFDLDSGLAEINLMHPFFANFVEDIKNPLPFKLIALTEILTEVSLVEQGIAEDDIKEIISRRDRILRELTFSDKLNAPVVASLLRASLNDPDGLEDAVAKSFTTLGFETTPIGGNGKPDGIAVANLGYKGSKDGYSFTYDAKSTAKDKIMASTAHISGVNRHRIDYKADYAVVVAIDFQGGENPESAVNKEAKELKVNLIRARDLWSLMLSAAPKQLGLNKLRELFQTCHTVVETEKWIDDFKNTKIDRGPIQEILETAHELTVRDIEKPNITAIRMILKSKYPHLKDISSETIKNIIQSLKILLPEYISFENGEVSLQNKPEIILTAINQISSDSNIPFEFRDIFMDAFASKS